jgi:hypothetical protein
MVAGCKNKQETEIVFLIRESGKVIANSHPAFKNTESFICNAHVCNECAPRYSGKVLDEFPWRQEFPIPIKKATRKEK